MKLHKNTPSTLQRERNLQPSNELWVENKEIPTEILLPIVLQVCDSESSKEKLKRLSGWKAEESGDLEEALAKSPAKRENKTINAKCEHGLGPSGS